MADLSKVPWRAIQQLKDQGNHGIVYDEDGFVSKITLHNFPDDFTMGQLEVFPRLESIEVQSRYYFQDDKMIGISKLANLKHFSARNCRYASNGVIELLAEAPALESVEIKNCSEIQSLQGLKKIRHLKHLTITPEGTMSFRPLIECRSLESLVIENTSVIDDLALKDIARVKSLKSLTLKQLSITDEGLSEIGKLPSLEKLDLSHCQQITGTGFADFQFPETLRDLNLEDTHKLNDDGLAELTRFTNLEHLRMQNNGKVKGKGFTCLANMQKLMTLGCPTTTIADEHLKLLDGIESLEMIWLNRCPKISGRGLAHLTGSINCKRMSLNHCRNIDSPDFEVIAKFKNLEELYLVNTRIRPDGIEQLCGLKKLKNLNIEGNVWIDDSAFEKLQRSTVSSLTATLLPRLTDHCFEFAAKMPNLKELRVSANSNLDGSGLGSFIGNETLKELVLEKPKHLSVEAFSLIRQIPNIEKLKFGDGDISIAQIEQLSGMSNLKSFNYSLNSSDQTSERLPSILRSFQNQ